MSPRLSIIPAGAVTDRSLKPRDLQVLCLLGRHIDRAGWCARSQVRMALELDCGRASLQRSLERLVDAGWVQKKVRFLAPEQAAPKRPSASYAYRVVLDRDDAVFESAVADDSESHAENASPEAPCPPVGTPPGIPQTVPTRGHPCPPIHGQHNDLSEREGKRETRARDRKAKGLSTFQHQWPTSALDDQQRTAYAWEELTEAEQDAALAGIGPFLENLKKLGRKHVPAGWKYLEEKRWTLLEARAETAVSPADGHYGDGSPEAKALEVIHAVAGQSAAFHTIVKSRQGGVWYRKPITPQLLALAHAPPRAEWVAASRREAGAWNDLADAIVTVQTRTRLKEGDRVPWHWPPRIDGTLSPHEATTAPPVASEQDAEEALREFASER